MAEVNVVKAERVGDELMVTVESDSMEAVINPQARRVAYEARYQDGFSNAGIEAFGGPYPVDLEGNEASNENLGAIKKSGGLRYRNTFRLTKGL